MKYILLFIISINYMCASAQQEQNNWYFGRHAAMSFETGVGRAKYDNPQNTYRKTACISDPKNGNLLFYSDGITIWNHKHAVMMNGNIVVGAIGDLIIFPQPESTTNYYLFIVGDGFLRHVLIDMSRNNGDGEVITGVSTISGSNLPQVAVIRHQYTDAYWVITHEAGSNRFRSYLVDKSGVNTQGVLSDLGLPAYTYGDMAGSSKGDKLAVTHFYQNDFKAEVFDFDRVCGRVSHAVELSKIPAWEHAYGIAFSPDDSKLYITYGVQQSQLVQYYGTDYQNSYFIAGSPQNFNIMRMGPDGRIYMATHDNGIPGERINAIFNPNALSGFCDFRETYLRLDEGAGKSRVAYFELPAFASGKKMQSPLKDSVFYFSGSCVGDTVKFTFNTSNPYDSLFWRFGNPGNTQSQELNPVHFYKTGGRFGINLTIYRCGKAYELFDTISIDSFPDVDLPGDTSICAGNAVELKGPVATKYQWSTNETTRNIFFQDTGVVWLRSGNGNCYRSDSVYVSNYPEIITLLGDQYFICEDDEELVKLDAGEGFVKYKWTPTLDTTQWIIVKNTGDYFVKVTDNFGCPGDGDTKVKRRCGVLLFFPNIFTPNNDGLNDVYMPAGNDVVTYRITIHNSWGELVFTSDDFRKGWNGSFKDKPSPDGVYVYQAEYTGYKNKRLQTFSKKGNLTLLR